MVFQLITGRFNARSSSDRKADTHDVLFNARFRRRSPVLRILDVESTARACNAPSYQAPQRLWGRCDRRNEIDSRVAGTGIVRIHPTIRQPPERLFARTAPDYDVTFIVQPHPLGTADALQRCAATVDEPYVATLCSR